MGSTGGLAPWHPPVEPRTPSEHTALSEALEALVNHFQRTEQDVEWIIVEHVLFAIIRRIHVLGLDPGEDEQGLKRAADARKARS